MEFEDELGRHTLAVATETVRFELPLTSSGCYSVPEKWMTQNNVDFSHTACDWINQEIESDDTLDPCLHCESWVLWVNVFLETVLCRLSQFRSITVRTNSPDITAQFVGERRRFARA